MGGASATRMLAQSGMSARSAARRRGAWLGAAQPRPEPAVEAASLRSRPLQTQAKAASLHTQRGAWERAATAIFRETVACETLIETRGKPTIPSRKDWPELAR